jgi:hypothetical protein
MKIERTMTMNEKDQILTANDLRISAIEIEDLQREDALGIPELGASLSLYGCCSGNSSL